MNDTPDSAEYDAGNQSPSAGIGLPDFHELALQSIWTEAHWRMAWETLEEPRLWPTLLDLARTVFAQPVGAARALNAAMATTVNPPGPGGES